MDESIFDDKRIDAMSEDIVDYLHMAAPDDFTDEAVHQLGAMVLMAAIAKLDVILPSSLN